MKGIKIIFPIMGIFLVVYIALVVMNGVKMNGIVSQLNELYDEDFTIVSSRMGNVFLDEDFEVAARSNKTERVYEFTYKDGKITGDYLLENKLLEISDQIKQLIVENIFVLIHTGDKAVATEDELTLDSLQVTIIAEQEKVNKEELVKKVQDAYSDEIEEIVIYEGEKEQVENVENELIKYYPQSEITEELLANYKFKQTYYVY